MVAYGFKKQFIEPIMIGLGAALSVDQFAAGMDEFGNVARPRGKRQTIRAIGKRRHARPGEIIQLYTAMRTKQCRKLGEGLCKSVEPIRLHLHRGQIEFPDQKSWIFAPDRLDEFARDDGFADWQSMRKFWFDEHRDIVQLGPFVGVLIKWDRT